MDAIFNFFAEHFDLPILDWIAAHLHCDFLDAVMPVITALANAGIFWIALTVLLLALPKHRRTGIAMSFALIMGLIVCNLILKPAFARIRPYDYQLAHYGKVIPLLINAMHDFSFPSGHTMGSFEAATALALGNKKLGIPALILACLIAFSRLYLYVHYPTDVLFSIAMGITFGFIGHYLAKKIPLNPR